MATPDETRRTHASDQLTGSYRLYAQQAWAYYAELKTSGFGANEALEFTGIMVREWFRAFFSPLAKPRTPGES